MNLQQLLSMKVPAKDKDDNDIEVSPEFRVAVQSITPEGVHIIIHADGHNSETLDFIVNSNELREMSWGKKSIDRG